MFYYMIHRFNIIPFSGTDIESKFVRIFMIGTCMHILTHGLLYSNIGNSIEHLKKYRYLIYLMWLIDFGYLAWEFMFNQDGLKIIYGDNPSIANFSKLEIDSNLSVKQKQVQEQSPFIKKGEQAKLENKPNDNSVNKQAESPKMENKEGVNKEGVNKEVANAKQICETTTIDPALSEKNPDTEIPVFEESRSA